MVDLKWKDFSYAFNEFWTEFRKIKSGMVGLVLLIILILTTIFEPIISPYPEATNRWRDITYWEDNPKSAAPVWTNWFRKEKLPETQILENSNFEEISKGALKIYNFDFDYNFDFATAPEDFIIHFDAIGSPIISINLIRPDGEKIILSKKSLNLSNKSDVRISLGTDAKDGAYKFANKIDYENSSSVLKSTINPLNIIFSQAKENIISSPEFLKGDYKITVQAIFTKGEGEISNPLAKINGKVSGVLGTDNFKRDLWSGVLAGIKWALLIGLLTAAISVTVGVSYGITSAYYGGWVDSFMQRILEFFLNIPFIPILIVISAIFKPSIWTLIILMCLLNWTGSVRTVRSMGLQIKEETYIEASKALGASNSRIIFKHMIPLLVPYSFANMALSVPAAILTEAGMSVLGLGDASIVTWGQILQDARTGGAMVQGIWWWIIPPGLMISVVGMTFAFIGFSMDKILMPKLKTR
ncbi:MAG: peptide/nickel transport system permease protein [Oceanotoga sp.]|nr:peptide/nickel transport system permease protein [Oceanotoga sp.]